MRVFFTVFLCGALPVFLWGQRIPHSRMNHNNSNGFGEIHTNRIEKKYMEALKALVDDSRAGNSAVSNTLDNPYYSSLFFQSALHEAPIDSALLLNWSPLDKDKMVPNQKGSKDNESVFDLTKRINEVWAAIYSDAPQLVDSAGVESGKDDNEPINTTPKEIKPNISLTETTKEVRSLDNEPIDIRTENLGIVVRKPNFWDIKFSDITLQFMQSYISSNWYKGGESNNSLMAAATIEANYNNKQKITFDNKLEMKLGFQSSRSDELHKYKTNSDQLRLTNKLGLRATKRWYYTLLLQSWTQFYPSYKSNDEKVYSDFMSPLESVFSIGMEYKLQVKNFNLSANISPLACDFKYVDRKSLSTSFGVSEGKHTKFEYGSNITINYTWDVIKNVRWKGRIYYYTDYDKAQIEWESTIDLTINRFLTTSLFLFPRFDDGVARDEGQSYFQFRQQLSLGLKVSF